MASNIRGIFTSASRHHKGSTSEGFIDGKNGFFTTGTRVTSGVHCRTGPSVALPALMRALGLARTLFKTGRSDAPRRQVLYLKRAQADTTGRYNHPDTTGERQRFRLAAADTALAKQATGSFLAPEWIGKPVLGCAAGGDYKHLLP